MKKSMPKILKFSLSSLIILAAVAVVLWNYWDYVTNPWTRDGQVRAQVIQITPRVSGPLVNLPIKDNQLVKADDLLFEIDPRTFQAAVKQSRADLRTARVKAVNAKEDAERAERIRKMNPGAMSVQELETKKNEQREAESSVLGAEAALEKAKLNLEFTQVKAPVDGYVTNLDLRLGSQAVENQAALALVDINSYWIVGFFKENYIANMRKGDRAIVTLMTYPDTPLEGRVDSLGWGIAQDDGSTGFDLLPTISATFEWIRLAQRVPVRIHIDLDKLPEGVQLFGLYRFLITIGRSSNGYSLRNFGTCFCCLWSPALSGRRRCGCQSFQYSNTGHRQHGCGIRHLDARVHGQYAFSFQWKHRFGAGQHSRKQSFQYLHDFWYCLPDYSPGDK
jgi:multidrug resistance efflux pump